MLIDFLKFLSAKGATTYYVGGYVRDLLLGKPNKDVDIEIYGITEYDFVEACELYNLRVDFVGKSFGIYKVVIDGIDFDFSFPRDEVKVGDKHTDFEVVVNPFMTPYEASLRRDFTINAMMKDTLTGELLDFHDGQQDLQDKVIRHMSPKFTEDGLRVYRAAQFAARFGFTIAPETKALFTPELVKHLAVERVHEELVKALLKPDNPQTFFDELPEPVRQVHFDDVAVRPKLIATIKELYVGTEHELRLLLMSIYTGRAYALLTTESSIVQAVEDSDESMLVEALTSWTPELMYKYLDAFKDQEIGIKYLACFARWLNIPRSKIIEVIDRYRSIKKAVVTGAELLDKGFKPGPVIGQIIKAHKELMFAGHGRDVALKLALNKLTGEK